MIQLLIKREIPSLDLHTPVNQGLGVLKPGPSRLVKKQGTLCFGALLEPLPEPLTMLRIKDPLAFPLRESMDRHQGVFLPDLQMLKIDPKLHPAASHRVRNRVEIPAKGDEPIPTHATLLDHQPVKRASRKHSEMFPFFDELLGWDKTRGSMTSCIGALTKPALKLIVQILEIPKASAQEKIPTNIADGPLDLSLGVVCQLHKVNNMRSDYSG